MSRIRLSKDLEKSANNGSLIVTDSSDEAYYYAPINPDDILILDNSTNVPRWSQDITVNGTLTLTRENDGTAHRILSQDAGGLVSARENIQIYQNIHSVSATPSITLGTGSGTGASFAIQGTNDAGTIQITVGTSPATSAIVATVNFSSLTYPNGCAVMLYPANSNAAGLSDTQVPHCVGATNNWTMNSNSTSLGVSTTYLWNYIVKGF